MDTDLRDAIALPHPHHPSSARVNEPSGKGSIRYLGLDVEPKGAIAPGTELRLTHYLRVEHGFDRNPELRIEVSSRDGRALVSSDHVPLEGRAPATRWRRGQIWADVHRLRVPSEAELEASGRPAELELWFGLVVDGAHGRVTTDEHPEVPRERHLIARLAVDWPSSSARTDARSSTISPEMP
jgi:hypothetical protein